MSTQPIVARALRDNATAAVAPSYPQTILVPVAARTIDGDTIMYMSHADLPAMQPYTFFGQEVFAHNLANDFAYECWAQNNSGSFHLIGAPGLFSVGAAQGWKVENGIIASYDFIATIVVTRASDMMQTTTDIKSDQQAQIFLGPGDMFRVHFYIDRNPALQPDDEVTMLPGNLLAVTRLSANPGWTPPIAPP